ncbi:MAG: uroporphyrinogen decarboxylase family protein [Anaerolineae bacterium]
MSHRSDALTAMRGEESSRIPFIGRMNLWYNYHHAGDTLPERYQGWSLWDIQRDLGIGILGFGAWMTTFFKKVYHDVEITRTTSRNEEVVEYTTPCGTLRSRHTVTDMLRGTVDTGRDIEQMFKNEQDYDALQYLVEHTEIVENYEEYSKFVDSIGEDGIALPFTGWVPMHEIMWRYMGVERFYYELQDHRTRLERLHAAVLEQHRKIIRLAVHCPATAIEVGGNYTEQLTPPHIFDHYFAPFYREVAETFENAGNILVVHGDGDMNELLRCLMDVGVQVVEALTPKPVTSIDIRETRSLWGDKVTMWGGIPFIILTPQFSDSEFKAYMKDLYRAVAPGDRFVLGFGDNVPPEAPFDRIRWIADFHKKNSAYPIEA